MARHIDQILVAAVQRQLSEGEVRLLASYLRDLEGRQARPDDVLEKELSRVRQDLSNCRRLIKKYDINEIMD